jgi:hypothetical protein
MNDTTWILLVVASLAIGASAAWFVLHQRRTKTLRTTFGPEYEHAVRETGNRRRAEAELLARRERVEKLHIHPLSNHDRDRFHDAWQEVQASFVDDPAGAIGRADQLVAEVMQTRGYPVGDFEQRAADISVDHPRVVENYRAAHEIAQRNERGAADTEDSRKAMIHYRELFEDLLEVPGWIRTEDRP